MSLIDDSDKAAEYLEHLQRLLWSKNDHSQDDDLASIICMLGSPMFRQLLTLQESLKELKHVCRTQTLSSDAFDIAPTGELILHETSDGFSPENVADSSTLKLRGRPFAKSASPDESFEHNAKFEDIIHKMADGRPVYTVQLTRTDNSSLGFSVVGIKHTDRHGELGIYVRDIQPGGLAAQDGRLQEGDQLLAINGQPLQASHQEAIRVLQGTQGPVQLLVASSSPRSRRDSQTEDSTGASTPPASEGQEAPGVGELEGEETLNSQDRSDMVLSTDWTQLEVIDLINDGSGLGFGIIGGRSTGVVVKTILPGGIADQEGHLRSGDHILQIGEVNVRGMSSEQVALVLRQSGSHVRLVVARSVHEAPHIQIPQAPIIPTHQLEEHMEHFNALMAMDAGDHDHHLQEQLHHYHLQQQQQHLLLGSVQVHPLPMEVMPELAEVDLFEVDLMKDAHGLGITIAGYVGGDNTPEEISGIFVKSITDRSAAALDGRVHVNDQIIEVDGKSLQGFSNHQAVEVLKNTGQLVRLKLVRFRHGPKFDKLQEYLAQANTHTASVHSPVVRESPAVSNPTYDFEHSQTDIEDVSLLSDDYIGQLSPDVEASIKAAWEPVVGPEFLVVVAQLAKFKEGGGLGISLEGTVDVEDGVEVRPHHYIRSILPDGPVGLNGRLKSSDELLEVNGRRLLGLNHVHVVEILKDLPQHVRLVCARRKTPQPESFSQAQIPVSSLPAKRSSFVMSSPVTERLVKAKSELALSTCEAPVTNLNKSKSRSLEPLTGLAMWSSQPVVIELDKGDRGLGFSILDYQDPVNPNDTVIVIRSLVPGGVAQQDGRLVPGDRLIFVNEVNVEHATLDEAVQALKGAARGLVKIGVAKPLPLGDAFDQETQHILPEPHLLSQAWTSEDNIHLNSSKESRSLQFPTGVTSVEQVQVQIPGEEWSPGCPSATPALPASSLQHSPAESKSSIESDHKFELKRKDSFYESDEETQVSPPVFSAEFKALHSLGPASVSLESTKLETGVAPERSVRAPAIAKPPRTGKPKKDSRLQNSSESISSLGGLSNGTMEAAESWGQPSWRDIDVRDRDDINFRDMELLPSQVTSVLPPCPPSYEEVTSELASQEMEASTKPNLAVLTDKMKQQELVQKSGLESNTRNAPPPIPPKPQASLLAIAQKQSQLKQAAKVSHSESSSSPSSLEQITSSDLQASTVIHTIEASRRYSSGPASPDTSPALERTIHVQKSGQHLGLSLEAVDKAASGCLVKSVSRPSAVDSDGRIQVGDYIVAINNESLRRITNAQARAILRRSSLLGSDISISYIPGQAVGKGSHTVLSEPMQSPILRKLAKSLSSSEESTSSITQQAQPQEPVLSSRSEFQLSAQSPVTDVRLSPAMGQKTLQTDGSPAVGNQVWGPPRTVELVRETGKSLGISIVGGRVDMFNVSQEHCNAGIFIKHVLPDSPAGRNGTLKKGDRILEVNGADVRNATHDEAVEVIRHASSPISFLVQSLSFSSCPVDLEASQLRAARSLDEPSLQSQSSLASSTGSTSHQSFENIEPKLLEDNEEEDEYKYTKKGIEKKYSELPGLVQLVDLNRGTAGIGLGLAGNKDRSKMSVFVAGIQPDSPADRDGRIIVGDELLEVNGINLSGLSHLNASAIIKGITTPVVKLVTHRRENSLDDMAVKPISYGSSAQFEGPPVSSPSPRITAESGSSSTSRRESSQLLQSPSSRPAVTGPPSPVQQLLTEVDTIQVIVLHKPPSQSLGFGIQEDTRNGRHGIYVISISEDGVAHQDHQLEVGDEILEVGDKSLAGLHYEKAIECLRVTQGSVRLKVRKANQGINSTDLHNSDMKMQLSDIPGESTTDPSDMPQDNGDPAFCPIVVGRRTYIEIEKGKTGLGLSIVGGSDTLLGAIIIHEVYDDGAAAKDGRLWAGDQILEVNGEDLTDATHNRALQVLRQTPSTVKMIVYRDESQVQEEDILDIFSVDLAKRPGKGLGLSIVGKKNDVGIYISDIVKGGVAEADGRLMQGDQILAVNGEDMRSATQEYAAGVLKTVMGRVSLTVGRLKAGSKASSRKNSGQGTSLKKSDSSVSNKSKGKHSKSASEDASYARVVKLEQDPSGSFGISLAGGLNSPIGDAPVIVASLNPSGPAAVSGKVKIGDKIVSINEMSTVGMTHEQVISTLKASKKVTLTLVQGEAVSISGQRSRHVSDEGADTMLKDISIEMEDDGQAPLFKTITLNRGPEGLGFSIVGGHGSPHGDLPIYVKNVFNKGAAADEGTLARGDQILSVNGQSLEGFTHEQAVNILKNTQGTVILGILS